MINWHQLTHFIKHFFLAKRNGHAVHSPFAYNLCEEVFYNSNAFYDFDTLKQTRNLLLQDATKIVVEDFGAGSKFLRSNTRRIKDITDGGVSRTFQSEVLYKLINYLKFNSVIELGTSIGLNSLYLAKANCSAEVVTVEGSQKLCEFAASLAEKHQIKNIRFVCNKFDEALPEVLTKIKSPFLLFIDGNHTYEATIKYFELVLTKKDDYTVVIFDDIYWSAGMTKAWQEIKNKKEVLLSIDTFYFGMVFFRSEFVEKIDLKIFI